jgi:hypothetical protein
MGSACPAIPEPDWLSEEAKVWLDVIDATNVEERHRNAAQQVTTSLRELKSVRDLHDGHPVIGTLVQAIEQRDIATYSQAYALLCQIEQRHPA